MIGLITDPWVVTIFWILGSLVFKTKFGLITTVWYGLISSLKFVSENKALPKSTKKLLFKVIDDYVQIIDELKNYLTEKYS